MRKNIHPSYRAVAFHDTRIDQYFFIGSTVKTDQTIERDGKEYPYMAIDVSSASHPFYTGEQRTHDGEGRIAQFRRRYRSSK
ncbi:MAG: type B 50S ribosomal protein L31 [Marinomonas sp.]